MKRKINSVIISLVVCVITLITIVSSISFSSIYEKNEIIELQNECSLVIKGYELDDISYLESIEDSSLRVTLIDLEGNVIFDNQLDESEMENHASRKEFKEAKENGYGISKRYSSSLLKTFYYVAYKLDNNIIRVSKVADSTLYILFINLWPLYIVAIVLIICSILLGLLLSKKIVDPINNINLEHPLENNKYKEIEPLLIRIEAQKNELMEENEEVLNASKVRQEFTSNVSHELKTPLHVISGYAELIKEGIVKDSDVKEFGEKIYSEASRMSKLVEDIMKISKLESDKTIEKTQLKLKNIVVSIVDSLMIEADKKNIKFKLSLNDCSISGNYDSIYSLIFNLVDNAIKYNKTNGKITIKLQEVSNNVILSVKDTGIGIPKEDLDRIFERFYRVDKSRSKDSGGTGLGLAIVKHSLIVNNATIKVESELKKGSTFTVTF
ncbi:MAG: ATP-binding protein [Candidatus Onthovivens sp.]|nr:ATP-binding protein [Candidatus Onthovivens sp.]